MLEQPPSLRLVDRHWVLHRGRRLLFFGGCDYFRLSSHPRLLRAVATGLERHGLTVAASRLTTGNHPLYSQFEEKLARQFHQPSATLVSCGSMTGLITAQAMAGEFSDLLLDERAHPALQEAAPFFQARLHRFRSRDPQDVARRLKQLPRTSRVILLTDGLFAADGSVAPLREYLALLPRTAWMLIDDAHGAGVLGDEGGGTPEHLQVDAPRLIQCVTLSKAFGLHGGAILGPRLLREKIFNRSRLFIGSTPPVLPLIHAALSALKLLGRGSPLRRRLLGNVRHVKERLRHAGLDLPDHPGPMVPMTPRSAAAARELKRALLEAGIYPPFLRYPGGPEGGGFRFIISSEHTRAQLDRLLAVLVPHIQRKLF